MAPARLRASARLRHIVAGVGAGELLQLRDPVAAPTTPLTGGRLPQRVPVADTAAVQAALAKDGAVILTNLPGAAASPIGSPRWEEIAGELPDLTFGGGLFPGLPPVACVSAATRPLGLRCLYRGVLTVCACASVTADAPRVRPQLAGQEAAGDARRGGCAQQGLGGRAPGGGAAAWVDAIHGSQVAARCAAEPAHGRLVRTHTRAPRWIAHC